MGLALSIVIVNYNGAAFLNACLDSVFASQTVFPFEVIVVDNASVDQSLEVLRASPHPIHLIESPVNLGFAAGNNLGAKKATGTYLFLLNNDTVMPPDTLDRLVRFYIDHPEIGLLSPKLLNGDGSIQGQGSSLMAWRYKGDDPISVSFISGAAMMTRRALYAQLGGLDEHYFFYNEDIDFCKTVIKSGRKLMYLPTALVTHFGGLSTATRKRASIVEGYRGGLYLCRKHYGPIVYTVYRGVLLIVVLISGLWASVSLGSSSRRERILAYWEILFIIVFGAIKNVRPKGYL